MTRKFTFLSFVLGLGHKEPASVVPDEVKPASKVDGFFEAYVDAIEEPTKYDRWCDAVRSSTLSHNGSDPE